MTDSSSAMAEQVLRALGLDAVCVHVYLMMHASPDADADEIAERLNLEMSDVTDALDVLAELTLLRSGIESSNTLRPVSIERALHTLLRQHSEQLALQSDSLAMLQTAMKDLLASPTESQGSPDDVDIEFISGSETLQSTLERLGMRATQTFDAFSPGGPVPKEVLDAARPFDEELAKRGIQIRALYQTSVRTDGRNLAYTQWLQSMGVQTRFAPLVPARVILIDKSIAMIPTGQRRPSSGAFVIREPAIIAPLLALFESVWEAAEPHSEEAGEPEDTENPTKQETALLRILAAGSTDEAAAKKLGVSVRTVRRMMADLMERLGASSRFEAGHRATQRGWL